MLAHLIQQVDIRKPCLHKINTHTHAQNAHQPVLVQPGGCSASSSPGSNEEDKQWHRCRSRWEGDIIRKGNPALARRTAVATGGRIQPSRHRPAVDASGADQEGSFSFLFFFFCFFCFFFFFGFFIEENGGPGVGGRTWFVGGQDSRMSILVHGVEKAIRQVKPADDGLFPGWYDVSF